MPKEVHALVTGAKGFIGHHLVKCLVQSGYIVRGVDIKAHEYQQTDAHEFVIADLRNHAGYLALTRGVEEVYHLAAEDMGTEDAAAARPDLDLQADRSTRVRTAADCRDCSRIG